jgi:hypothetical protein
MRRTALSTPFTENFPEQRLLYKRVSVHWQHKSSRQEPV